MKVFYVMVLVLVAWAVPSHGRTKSESTVFKKTQPYEFMNNGTVSSSKLEAYSFSYLVMQWPKSFCDNSTRQCNPQIPSYFTVHGLWPNGIDCNNLITAGNYSRFDINKLNQNLVSDLNYYWPDLTASTNNNTRIWEYQYNKHGSCTFNDQNRYFELTVSMVKNLGNVIGPTIILNNSYSPEYIRDAVFNVTKVKPRLHCVTVGVRIQLLELRFRARPNSSEMYDSNAVYSGCGTGEVYLPSP